MRITSGWHGRGVHVFFGLLLIVDAALVGRVLSVGVAERAEYQPSLVGLHSGLDAPAPKDLGPGSRLRRYVNTAGGYQLDFPRSARIRSTGSMLSSSLRGAVLTVGLGPAGSLSRGFEALLSLLRSRYATVRLEAVQAEREGEWTAMTGRGNLVHQNGSSSPFIMKVIDQPADEPAIGAVGAPLDGAQRAALQRIIKSLRPLERPSSSGAPGFKEEPAA